MGTDQRVYDDYANPYDLIQLNWTPYLELRDLHLSFLKDAELVLDDGTGTGNQTVELLKEGKEVHAIDINEAMLGFLFKKVDKDNPLLHTYTMSAEDLDFPDEHFDGVTAMNMIYNLPNPGKGLSEGYRVTKKGGVFCMSGPTPDASVDAITDNAREEFKAKGMYDEKIEGLLGQMKAANKELVAKATFYTAAELEKILTEEIGFKEIIHSTETPYLGNAYFVAARK